MQRAVLLVKQAEMQLQGKKQILCSYIVVSSPPSIVSIKEHFLHSSCLQMCPRSCCLVSPCRHYLGKRVCDMSCIYNYKMSASKAF